MGLFITLALRNLGRSPKRSLMLFLAMLLGLVGTQMVFAFVNRTQRGLDTGTVFLEHKGHFSILKPNAKDNFASNPTTYSLSPVDVELIQRSLRGLGNWVERSYGVLVGGGLLSNEPQQIPFLALGMKGSEMIKNIQHPDVLKWAQHWTPKDFDVEAWKKQPQSISLTPPMAQALKIKELTPVQAISMDGQGSLNGLDVTANFRHLSGSSFLNRVSTLFHLETLQSLLQNEGVFYWAVVLREPLLLEESIQRLQRIFQTQKMPFQILSYVDESWSPYSAGTMEFLHFMGYFLGFLLFSAVGFSLANLLILSFLERRSEIGTLKAIGFRPHQIRWIFVLEISLLSLGAILSSFVLAPFSQFVINGLEIPFTPPGTVASIPFQVHLNLYWSLDIALILFVLMFLVAWLLSWQFSKKKPLELL